MKSAQHGTRNVQLLLFLLFVSVSTISYAQDFTAKTIGDYGNVAVMEMTGNYDAKNPDGSINNIPRQAIAKEFFRTHKDEYDFLVIFSNFDFKMPDPEAKAFYSHVKNDVRGIGLNVFDGSALFGSNGKLQGVVDMGNLSGLVVDPLDPGFEEASFLLSHELVHRWGAYAKFKDASGNISDALLGRDGTHWSFLLDSRASVLYGNQWQNNGNGTFTSVGARRYYSPLDLYLMGLYEKSQVPPMLLIDNPAINPATLPAPGATISGTARTITIDQIVAAEGERIPGPSDSQKTFKTACIFITTPGTFTGSELYGIENIRGAWVTRFSILTDGQAILDVDVTPTEDIPTNPGIPDSPFTPRTLPSNIDDGVKWLMNNQRSDGSWADLPQTIERETAGTVLTLRNFDIARENFLTGLLWLEATYSGNIDYLSRKIEAFSNAGKDVKTLLDEVVSRQNSDGGWGSEKGYLSNPTDTSFALKAMAVSGYSDLNIISRAIEYLKSKQNADGGWGNEDEGSSIQSTANVLLSFNKYRDYPLDSQVARGRAWLMQRQNPDGGFGNSPSTIYDTAIAVLTLREFEISGDIISNGLNYLLNLQSGDGSWYGSPYQTAVAVSAVWKATVDPDLSIKSDDITFTPPSVNSLPLNITIHATLSNSGRTDVPQAKVVLYEGAISDASKVGEQILGFPGQSSVTVSFSVTIRDGNEHRFYVSVDPGNLVKESNETNNIASKILYPETTYDFEILPSDVSVSPNPVDIFSDVKITSKITNKGTMNAYNVQAKYYIDEVGGPIDIATVTVDIPANATITKVITWRANRAGENLPVTVYVDPLSSFKELSETNNKALTFLTVNGSTDPNLTISYKDIVITPTPAQERGNVNLLALVKNEGFSAASNINVSFYKGVPGKDGVLLGSQIIPLLNTGESKRVSIDWVNITDSGERVIYVQVDPGNQIQEIRKDDNDAFIILRILSLPDLTISTNSIVFTPTAPKDGDKVAITVTVQNKGEQDVSNVTVKAFEGNAAIGTQVIHSILGNSQSAASFTYDTAGKSGPYKITITVDPDHTIVEQSKDNNQASRTIGVQKADLWLTEPYISPNGDGVKDSTQFFFRLNTPQTVKIVVVSEKGETVRSFSGGEFENTNGGNVIWDGLNDKGMVVDDGDYQIRVVDRDNRTLGSLIVNVDNNRSPLTKAIGTKYLLNNNLTCMLPYIGYEWFPDESGILFRVSVSDRYAPAYPTGLYTMAPDGGDIVRIIPWEWTEEVNPRADYYIRGHDLSPDGEKVAFSLLKRKKVAGESEVSQLWIVDRDGGSLKLLDSYDLSKAWDIIEDPKWSLNGEHIAYSLRNDETNRYELWIISSEGLAKKNIDDDFPYWHLGYMEWSPDSKRVAYISESYDAHGDCVANVRLSDLSGAKRDVFALASCYGGGWAGWLSDQTLLVIDESSHLWLVDASGLGNHINLSNAAAEVAISPDKRNIAFIERGSDQWSVKVSDETGTLQSLHHSPSFEWDSLQGLRWSPDGSKLAFIDSAFQWVKGCCYEGYLITVDVKAGNKAAFKVSDAMDLCDLSTEVPRRCSTGGEEWDGIYAGYLRWLSSTYLIAKDRKGIYAIHADTGEKIYFPIEGWSAGVSPLGRYITYDQSVNPSSVCYGGKWSDMWALSSLLNLTADLRVRKEKTAVILKGTAIDLNFEGYRLEYADTKSPTVWNLVAPPLDIPVINDTFTTWIPPYEGIFYVRLTVWDKAGNVAQDRKRVSWGLSASITNLYKTLEIFSPNGDGVKDTVELHYKVLEPVHLEFYVYDEKGNLKRTFSKDHPFPTDDFITWDGRDESGRVVPDGKYKIRVFDYEFFVEVDNTFPEVNIELGSVQLVSVAEEIYEITAEIVGHAFDHHIKNWVIEYGEGDNPPGWFEFIRGVDPLVKRDDKGNPILNPVKDTSIERFIDADIEWLVGKKLRITAEDFAGNKSTAVTEFLEEKIILSRWDSESVLDTIPAHLARPGLHSLGGLESIRLPIVSFNVQYWVGDRWLDTSSVMDPPSGGIHLEWDNSALNLQEGYAVRLKAVDILGQEHYSNALRTRDLFDLYLNKTCQVEARNSLFEKLRLLKFEAAIYPVISGSQWKDYFVLDSQRGDSLPEGEFAPPLPPLPSGTKYAIRMIGISESGEEYESRTVSYPACTGFHVNLDVSYDETDCGLILGKATLQSKLVLGKEFSFKDVAFRTLSYYLQKPEGFQLLRQFDLTREEWGSVNIDTVNMPEGNYPVEVILTYLDLVENTDREASASNILVIDRVLPTARITYPGKSMKLCPVRVSDPKGDWYGIPVEGVATDNKGIKEYALYYGIGENASGWIPATTRKENRVSPISGDRPVQGSLGLWDITPLRGETFSLKLKAVDKAGNVKCDTTSFSFDNLIEIVHLSKDNPLFSPNGDGILDEMEIRYEIDEYATVDAKVFKLIKAEDGSYGLDSLPVRTIASGLQHLGGMENASWDGRDDSDTVVADGLYGIAVFAKDSCGNTNLKWTSVEVDNTPPQTIITYPRPPDPIGNIVEIRGTADDLNFQNYLLEASKFDQPDTWFLISSNNNTVKDDVLGTWNNFGLDGTWTLRLTATDKVGNKNTTTVTIDLGSRKKLIKDLTANPRLFSPNNDGKLDTAKIDYELTYACDVKIEFRDLNGGVKKTYTTIVSSGGTYTCTWDGKDDTGVTVPDGAYTVKLTATLSSNTSVTQNETITLMVDSTSPIVHIQQPLNNSYVRGPVSVMGTISDRNLLEYSLSYTGEAGTVLLDKANQNRENYTFGILHDLAEGSYTLHIEARDLGENIIRRDVAFTVDRTPPQVTLSTPKEGEYYGSEKNVIPVSGSIVEKNLETYSLRYGAGDNPAQWTELMSGNTIPSNPQLLSWKVGKNDGIPDGLYTLFLYAKDKAGSTGEVKVKIIIDNTAPEVAIVSPKEGDYVKAPIDIKGTALDPSLEQYSLEMSEGQCSSAFKWAAIRTATNSIRDGLLAAWLALPPDGDYCLRLTAVDKIGNKAETKVSVRVDTHPPVAPALSGKVENKADIRLSWTQNKEPDLAGFHIYRDKQKVNAEVIRLNSYLDQNLKEGIYAYTVQAVDFAGNESKPSNEEKLKVDLTAPDARIRSPQDGSRVSGLVDIKGTAISSDDFKQYRISIGQGSSPSQWNLIRTSPVPISYGSLVQWDTLGLLEQSYSIKLEAEDLSGNINTHQITVAVDNRPPAKPELISAVPNNADATLTWKANTEPDLAGYLLYRNDQLANVWGVVIGDLKPYLIVGTTYLDKALPDGKFKYYLVAVDLAGNMSDQSNSLEVEIDTRNPHATIVEPEERSKFQNKTFVKAEASDIDIASVQFQYKRVEDAAWTNLGNPVTNSSYVTYIDPIVLGLTFGDYNLRAVATDTGGKADPSPSSITVTYTDLTAPNAPKDLKAITNGREVTLTWTASQGADLDRFFDGYYVYRTSGGKRTKVNTSAIKDTTCKDSGLSDGLFTYEVTAADTYGNESEPSGSASARVYAPAMEQPYTPTGQKVIQVNGKDAEPGASVEISLGSSSTRAVTADSEGNFALANLELNLGENHITAKAADNNGNVSRVSETVVVVYNEPPATPTGLALSVQDYNVNLTWDPNGEPDLSGYNLYRDGKKVNQPVAITSGDISASSYEDSDIPQKAFDSDLSTYWSSPYGYGAFDPVWWEIELPEAELISHFVIHWGYELDDEGNEILWPGRDFEIQVWSGYTWITQVEVTENSQKTNVFDFRPSYKTDRIRVYVQKTNDPDFSQQVKIAEVEILKENLIPDALYNDTGLDDGEYGYRVTAVDYYGFESLASNEVKATVGNVIPPSAPQNLTAAGAGPDMALTWSQNSEPDLAGYNLYRNSEQRWVRLNNSLLIEVTYRDVNLRNGTYTYRMTAVDLAGNESLPSDEASGSIDVKPPEPPTNLRLAAMPEGRRLQASWEYAGGPVAGYNLYRSTTSGGPYQKGNRFLIIDRKYLDSGLTNGTAYYYVVTAADAFGNESNYSNEAMAVPSDQIPPPKPEIFFPTLPGIPIVLYENTTDVSGLAEPGSTVELFKDGLSITTTKAFEEDSTQSFSLASGGYGLVLSPDGKLLAHTSSSSIWLRDLRTGITSEIVEGGRYPIWSPDGGKLTYQFTDDNGIDRIGIFDIKLGQSAPLTNDSNGYYEFDPSWSADGRKIAFSSDREGTWDIWMKDLVSGSLTQVTHGSDAYYPNLTPDGKKVAYFDDEGLSLIDVLNGETVQIDPGNDLYSVGWSPDGRKLAFASYRTGNSDIFVVDVETLSQTQVTATPQDEFSPIWSPNGRNILLTRQEDYTSIYATPSDGQGGERSIKKDIQNLNYLFWTKSGEIAYGDQDQLNIISLEGHFRFKDVVLDSGENLFYVSSTDSLGRVSPPSDEISVVFDASQIPDLVIATDDIFIYPPILEEGKEVSIQAMVWNNGQVGAKDVDVDVYLWDSTGRMELVKSERIPSIAPASGEVIAMTWSTAGKTGANKVIVVVDPEDRINEVLETNNTVTREFFVMGEEKISLTTTLDASQYGSDQDVKITIHLQNSSTGRDVVVEARIEDLDGYEVVSLNPIHVYLAYASQQTYTLLWNTGSTWAGAYRVRTVLKNEPTVVSENLVPFAILPEIDIDSVAATDKSHYGPNENVAVSLNVKNSGRNYAIPELDVKVRIVDSENRDLFSEDEKIRNLLPGLETAMNSMWNTGLQPPGDYHAAVEIYLEGQKISNHSVAFKVDASSVLTGLVTAIPQAVFLGHSVEANYTIQNSGNTDISSLSVKVLVVDAETQTIVNSHEDVISLMMNSAQTGKAIFPTEGFGLKTYAINLRYIYQGSEKSIGQTSFAVKDGTPPVVTILSPSSNQYFNMAIHVAATATDLASGIDRVEYQVDGGSWKLLPVSDLSQGRYSITWSPTASDEGLRTIQIRATDRAGNISLPVSVLVGVDLTPPQPPVIVSPLNNSVLSSEVIDINGVAEPGAAVEMAFVSTFRTEADAATGNFSFTGVKLIPGENKFIFRTSDRAGNVSSPTEYTLYLAPKVIPVSMVTTDRTIYYPNKNLTITSTIQNPSQSYSLKNLFAKVSVQNNQGALLFTAGKTLPTIPAGQNTEWKISWNTAAHPKGIYAVKLEVLDGQTVLTDSTTSFEIRDPCEDLKGTINAQPSPIYQGKDETLTYSLTNAESMEMTDIKVHVFVLDPGTNKTKDAFEKIVTLPANQTLTGNFISSTFSLVPKVYQVILKVSSALSTQPRTLASTTFEVKPTIEVKKTIPDIKNLVVWVNEECKRDDPIRGQCHDDDQKKCIRLDLLEKILNEATDSYLIVHDREDIEKVKAPYYTDLLILGDYHFLSDPYRDELREMVYSGKGLISSVYLKREGCPKETDESLFGVEYEGHLPGDEHQVHFMDSSISEEMLLEAKGKAIRVEVDDPNRVVAWMKDSEKHQCHHKPEKHPGVVLNHYGLGNTVFFAFDLGSTLDDENYAQVSAILKNAIAYVHKPLDTEAFRPAQMIPIEIEVKSLGSATDARITESYPSEIKFFDPLTGKWVKDRPWVVDIHLGPDETKAVFFYALAPDRADLYTLQTEVGYLEDGIYNFSQSLSTKIVVRKDSAQMVSDIIRALKSLSVSKKDKEEREEAIEHMEKIQRRVKVTATNIEENIDDTMEAIDSLLSITSTDISQIRFMMDLLLEVYLGKLILLFSS